MRSMKPSSTPSATGMATGASRQKRDAVALRTTALSTATRASLATSSHRWGDPFRRGLGAGGLVDAMSCGQVDGLEHGVDGPSQGCPTPAALPGLIGLRLLLEYVREPGCCNGHRPSLALQQVFPAPLPALALGKRVPIETMPPAAPGPGSGAGT